MLERRGNRRLFALFAVSLIGRELRFRRSRAHLAFRGGTDTISRRAGRSTDATGSSASSEQSRPASKTAVPPSELSPSSVDRGESEQIVSAQWIASAFVVGVASITFSTVQGLMTVVTTASVQISLIVGQGVVGLGSIFVLFKLFKLMNLNSPATTDGLETSERWEDTALDDWDRRFVDFNDDTPSGVRWEDMSPESPFRDLRQYIAENDLGVKTGGRTKQAVYEELVALSGVGAVEQEETGNSAVGLVQSKFPSLTKTLAAVSRRNKDARCKDKAASLSD